MSADRDRLAALGRDLVRHVQSLLPIMVTADEAAADPGVQLQWIPVRLAGTLEGVLALGQSGLHEDAAALVRVMADHLVIFAWLLADANPPDRINAWKNEYLRLATARDNQLAKLGLDPHDPTTPLSSAVRWPTAEAAARECDEFWGQHLRPLLKPGTLDSFSGLYAAVFRGTSPYVHPSFGGSFGFITVPKDAKSGRVLRIGRSYGDVSASVQLATGRPLSPTLLQAVAIELLAVWVLTARFRHSDVAETLRLVDRYVHILRDLDQAANGNKDGEA